MLRFLVCLALFVSVLNGCGAQHLPPDQRTTVAVEHTPKNLILVVGDGMGPQQIGLLLAYAKLAPHSVVPQRMTSIERIIDSGESGIVLTSAHDAIVADSACSITQLASAVESRSQMLGLNSHGDRVETILEKALRSGKAGGLVTDTRLTHATPAGFISHRAHRSEENQIAEDLISSGVDVLLGGGLRHFLPAGINQAELTAQRDAMRLLAPALQISSKRNDQRNLLLTAQDQGFNLAFDRFALSSTKTAPVLGIFAESGMPDASEVLASASKTSRTVPTLPEMAEAALRLLSSDPDGFFLMIEAGQIDWAAHENDAGRLLHEMLVLDRTLAVVLDWIKGRTDTLLVLTADHETGSFGFSYSADALPKAKSLAGNAFKHKTYQPTFNFQHPEKLDQLYSQKQSFHAILQEFNDSPLPKTPALLRKLVEQNSPWKLSDRAAANILKWEPNKFYTPGHEDLGFELAPAIHDFQAFYPNIRNNQQILLARELAAQQGVVWGTGTHTSTPVLVTALGPRQSEFSGVRSMAELGRLLQLVYLAE